MFFAASLVANVGVALSSLPGFSFASEEGVMLPLLPFVEFSNAMKSSLMECRPLDRLNQSCLDPMSSSFQFCVACVSLEMRTGAHSAVRDAMESRGSDHLESCGPSASRSLIGD
jgi:hypothetical protein